MKIAVFGKSGPRLVTAGFVWASAAGPAAIQPAAASTTKNALKTRDISILPASALFCGSLSWRAALSRILERRGRRPGHVPMHSRDKGLFHSLGYPEGSAGA